MNGYSRVTCNFRDIAALPKTLDSGHVNLRTEIVGLIGFSKTILERILAARFFNRISKDYKSMFPKLFPAYVSRLRVSRLNPYTNYSKGGAVIIPVDEGFRLCRAPDAASESARAGSVGHNSQFTD